MQFDPSRWLDERLQKHVLSNPFNFVPFNAGAYARTILFHVSTHTHVSRSADLSRAAGKAGFRWTHNTCGAENSRAL